MEAPAGPESSSGDNNSAAAFRCFFPVTRQVHFLANSETAIKPLATAL